MTLNYMRILTPAEAAIEEIRDCLKPRLKIISYKAVQRIIDRYDIRVLREVWGAQNISEDKIRECLRALGKDG